MNRNNNQNGPSGSQENVQSINVDFDNVVGIFHEDENQRVGGLLSADIYDVPRFPGDRVNGNHYYREAITTTAAYYLYWAESPLLKRFSSTIGKIVGPGATIYDLGPGPEESIMHKTMVALSHTLPYYVYRPCDIIPEYVKNTEEIVQRHYPELPVDGVVLNFQKEQLPPAENDKTLILYLGSTISNAPSKPGWTFANNPYYAEYFGLLRRSAAEKGFMVITHDCNQDEKSLLASYNSESFAHLFTNPMHKVKRDLSSEELDADAFRYECVWRAEASCIEHCAVSTKNQTFTIHDYMTERSAVIKIFKGVRYIVVNSYKPMVSHMQQQLLRGGWESVAHLVDTSGRLATHLCMAV
jgi:uncharacterized SAM-dependent methyltransferase